MLSNMRVALLSEFIYICIYEQYIRELYIKFFGSTYFSNFFFFFRSLFLSFLLLQLCIPLFGNLCCSASITTLILNILCMYVYTRYDMFCTIKINYVIWQIAYGRYDLELVEPLNALKLSFCLKEKRLISSVLIKRNWLIRTYLSNLRI